MYIRVRVSNPGHQGTLDGISSDRDIWGCVFLFINLGVYLDFKKKSKQDPNYHLMTTFFPHAKCKPKTR